jgi:hypothetical protein
MFLAAVVLTACDAEQQALQVDKRGDAILNQGPSESETANDNQQSDIRDIAAATDKGSEKTTQQTTTATKTEQKPANLNMLPLAF